MSRSKPHLHWCWPEALDETPELRRQLEAHFELAVSAELPIAGSSVELLVPRLQHDVDAAYLNGLPSLQLIATPSTGTDHIDCQTAADLGIAVLSLKNEREFLNSVQSTAELAWLLVLACARRFREATAQPLADQWNAMDVRGVELFGKTIGIVGCGRLGSMMVRFAKAFRMRVLVCDVRKVDIDDVEQVDLQTLLQQSDIVSIHVHLDADTHHLIGPAQFASMKPGAIFVNTSRGGVIDETALLTALESGHIGAAGLDVLDGERQIGTSPHPLIEFAKRDPRLIITPHIGGCTAGAQGKAFTHFTRMLIQSIDTPQWRQRRPRCEV